MRPPVDDTWVALSEQPLPLGTVAEWAARPDCGAQVMFTGTVRDHAEGRPGVSALEYEAYAEQAEARLAAIAGEARRHWPGVGRIALLHRAGVLGVGQAAVVVAVATTHRAEAFAAARYCIDTLKATLPMWKKETWEGGHDWSPAATDVGAGVETGTPAP
ncbi:MAG: molybdenum cofactor biosynthesis protein MoaE [Acidimicrobiales bacterium]